MSVYTVREDDTIKIINRWFNRDIGNNHLSTHNSASPQSTWKIVRLNYLHSLVMQAIVLYTRSSLYSNGHQCNSINTWCTFIAWGKIFSNFLLTHSLVLW